MGESLSGTQVDTPPLDAQVDDSRTLILHHYATSPFAEKIRAILGYKNLAWTSVVIPVVMPKPDLVALTGGYRRTPVLQIGADIYCDTSLIADMLERIAPTPALFPNESTGLARIVAQWADSALFWTAIPHALQPAGAAQMFAGLAPEVLQAFSADRAAFRGNAPRMRQPENTAALRLYLRRFETMLLDGRVWLLGSAASIADFSVYHCLWFVRRLSAVAAILDEFPHVLAWLDRMKQHTQAPGRDMTSEAAIAIARSSTPARADDDAWVDFHDAERGDRVTVAPTDTGIDPVEGELVVSSRDEVAIRRVDERAGEVVVHFPRIGFEMRKLA